MNSLKKLTKNFTGKNNLYFMIKRESLPKIESELKEFLFEDGLKKIIEKINQLFSTKDHVAIAIGGPIKDDTRVGKTTLGAKIEINFIEQGIPVMSASSIDSFQRLYEDRLELIRQQNNRNSDKCLVILSAANIISLPKDKQEYFRNHEDNQLSKIAAPAGLDGIKIDFYILIYRPDKLPSTQQREFADIIVRNERAKD